MSVSGIYAPAAVAHATVQDRQRRRRSGGGGVAAWRRRRTHTQLLRARSAAREHAVHGVLRVRAEINCMCDYHLQELSRVSARPQVRRTWGITGAAADPPPTCGDHGDAPLRSHPPRPPCPGNFTPHTTGTAHHAGFCLAAHSTAHGSESRQVSVPQQKVGPLRGRLTGGRSPSARLAESETPIPGSGARTCTFACSVPVASLFIGA